MICQNGELAVLDGLFVDTYSGALSFEASHSTKEDLRKEQIDWMKEIRNTCKDVDCLSTAFSESIADNFSEYQIYNSYFRSRGWEKRQFRKVGRFCDFEYKKGAAVIVINVYCAGDGFNTLLLK